MGNPLDEGRLRATPVRIGKSTYLPLANPQLIDECFRTALRDVVAQVVRALVPRASWRGALQAYAEAALPAAARARFVAAAELDLESLNEVTAARYGFRPSELAAWTKAVGSSD